MNDEVKIKELADKYELPVEQVALIFSVAEYVQSRHSVTIEEDFIRDKML